MDQAVIEEPFSREQQVRHHHIWSNGAEEHRDRDTHIHQHPSQRGNSQRWTSWDPAIEYHSNWSAEYQPRIDGATDNYGFGGHSVLTSRECGTIFDPCTRTTAYQNFTHIHSNWGGYQPLPVPSIASNHINLRTRPLYVDPSNNCYQGEPSVALPPVTIYGETTYDLGSQHQGVIAASTNVHFGRENEDATSWRRRFKRKKSCSSSSLRPKDNIRSQDYSSGKSEGSRRYSKSQNQCTGRRSFKRNETPNHMNDKLHLKGVSTSGNPSPRVGSDTLVMAADGDDKVVTQGMQPDQCISDSPRAFRAIPSKKNDVESPKNASKCIHTDQKTEELLMDHLTVASSEANAVNQDPLESELKSSCEKYHIFPVNTNIHVSEKDEMTDAKVDLSRDVNEKFDETEHRVNSTAAVSQKDEIAGGNTDFNREVNEKPDQTNDTVITSKKRRKKKRSSLSKCGAEAIAEENDILSRRLTISSLVGTSLDHESVVPGFGVAGDMGTNLLETDVIGRVLANDPPLEFNATTSCEKYHIFPVNTNIHVSEKDEMTDAKVDLSRDVNEKFDETEHRVNSTAAVSQKDEIAGGNTDFNREVNEKPDQTNDTVITSKKRRKKKRSSLSKCGAEAIAEENDILSRRLTISSLVGTSLDHESVVPGFGVAGDMGTNLLETDVIGRVLANDPPLEFNATTSCEKHIPPGNTTIVLFENDATAIVNIDPSHEVNGKPEETNHSLNTVAVVLESDEMAVLNPDLNHEVNENPEGTQHIMQSNSQKRKRKRRSSSAKCGVESMTEEVTQRLPISSMGSLDNERAVSVSEVSVNGAVLANNNPSESSSACEKYHNVAASATMTVSGKAENIGVTINLNREVNEKPEETTDIVKTVSKRAKRKKHRSSSSKCAASSVTEEMIESSSQNLPIVGGTSLDHERAVPVSRATDVMTTSIPQTNVSGAALANDDPLPSMFTSSCEKYHISAVNTTLAVLEKAEIAGGTINLNHEVNEKAGQTTDIVKTVSKKAKRKKKRSSSSNCDLRSLTEEMIETSSQKLPIVGGTSLDLESAVSVLGATGVTTITIPETDVCRAVLANDHPFPSMLTSSCDNHHIFPLNTTMAVLENAEIVGGTINLNHEVNEKPEETSDIVKTVSRRTEKKKKRSRSSKCDLRSVTEEMIETSSQKLPILRGTSLDHESAVSVSGVTDVVTTSIPKTNVTRPVLADDHPVPSNMTREKYHTCLVDTTMVILEKDEMTGVNVDLSHKECEELAETKPKKRRKKHRSSSSKCGVESLTEEMPDISSRKLSITSMGKDALEYEIVASATGVKDDIPTKCTRTDDIGTTLQNDQSLASDLTVAGEKCHSAIVDTTMVVPDHESAVSVSGVTDVVTTSIPKTNVTRPVLADDHPVPSNMTREKYHTCPVDTTMVILEKDEMTGVNVDLSHKECEELAETKPKKRRKKHRSSSSKCGVESLTEEMPDISSRKLSITSMGKDALEYEIVASATGVKDDIPTKCTRTDDIGTTLQNDQSLASDLTVAGEKCHSAIVDTTMVVPDHESAVSVSGVTDVVTTSIPKTNVTRPVLADDHPVPSNMTREKYHTCPVDTTMVILEKDEMTGVNVDLSHKECEELAETKPKKRRKKHRSSSSKCGVESLTEEMPDISSRKLSITSMGKGALEYEIVASATGVKDDIPTKCTRTDNIGTTLQNDQSLASDLTVAGEKCHSAIVDATMVVPEKDARAAINVGLINEVNEEPEETKHMRDSTAIVLVNNEIAGVNTDLNHERNEKLEEGKLVVLVRTKKRKGSKQSSKYGVESMTEGLTDTSSQKLPVRVTRQTYLGSPKSRRKLLVLDVNGLLADIVGDFSSTLKSDFILSGKRVYKRPFCDDFLQFCFSRFNVGIWSSRTKKNVTRVIDIFMKKNKDKLLFCWDQSHCTRTGYQTLENKEKPLVLKELKNLWESKEKDLPWQRGCYDETNTILLDDSPYKALRNPPYTAVFPMPYSFKDEKDNSLGPDGDLRLYLKRLAEAENVQSFIQANPFGQRSITEADLSWSFYSKIAGEYANQEEK